MSELKPMWSVMHSWRGFELCSSSHLRGVNGAAPTLLVRRLCRRWFTSRRLPISCHVTPGEGGTGEDEEDANKQ